MPTVLTLVRSEGADVGTPVERDSAEGPLAAVQDVQRVQGTVAPAAGGKRWPLDVRVMWDYSTVSASI